MPEAITSLVILCVPLRFSFAPSALKKKFSRQTIYNTSHPPSTDKYKIIIMLTFSKTLHMKKFFTLATLSFYTCIALAQNVGVGTTTPSEKLDINGNLNVSGQFKVASDSGMANQVLTKNASNMPVWAELYQYKNFASFVCNNVAASAGANNCTDTWIVPAGITSILVECWGGGGGGSTATGGNGGGYIISLIAVTPGQTVSMTIGAGGAKGSVSVNGITGGTSTVEVNSSAYLLSFGGLGGRLGDPAGSITVFPNTTTDAFYTATGPRYITHAGESGKVSLLSFGQVSSTDFARIVRYGDGGDAGNLPHSGGTGGYRIISAAVNQQMQAVNTAGDYGGGGGADAVGGGNGRGGRVVVRW